MSERRSVIAPPEMMNGWTSGSTSSCSSARAMRIGEKVEEASGAALLHRGDEPVAGMEDEHVQRALRPGAVRGGVLLERQLEERVQLYGGAAAQCVFDDHPAGVDVAGAS